MTANPPTDPPPLRYGALLAYALPGLPLALLGAAMLVFVPKLYAEDIGLGIAVSGLVLTAARVWDIVVGPLLAVFLDRAQTRFGRRRPWPIVGYAVIMVASYMLFLPPAGAGAGYLFAWAALLHVGVWLTDLPYLAWGAELSPHYHVRTKIAAGREILTILGTLLVAGLPVLLLGLPEEYTATPVEAAMLVLFWLVAGLLPVSLAFLYGAVPEPAMMATRRLAPMRGIAMIAGNGVFRMFLGVVVANGLANAVLATLFLVFVEHVLGHRALAGQLLVAYFAAAAVAVPVWVWLSRRLGKHRVWTAGMVLAALSLVWLPFLGPGDFAMFLVICLVAGAALGADLAMPPAILADLLDLDTLRSGEARGAQYFAVWRAAGKFGAALALGIVFPLLSAFGFDPRAGASDVGLFALAALFGLVPAGLKLVAAGIIWDYPVDAATQARIRKRIERRLGGRAVVEETKYPVS